MLPQIWDLEGLPHIFLLLKEKPGFKSILKTQKDENRELLEGEEKEKKLGLCYYFLLLLRNSSCLSFFSNLHWFCSRESTVCWSCPFLGFNTETAELQSALQQTIGLPVVTNSFPALSSPARQSAFCSLSFKAWLCLLKERGWPSQMHFSAASTLPPPCY